VEAFARKGYAAASLDEIARAAQLTKGAVYHHFSGKQDLFRAVFDEIHAEFTASLRRAAEQGPDPWDGFLAGIRVFLDACLTTRFWRIALDEAPAALGWDTWREIEAQRARTLSEPLSELMRARILKPEPPVLLARVVQGMVGEAGRAVAEAPDPDTARRDAEALLMSLLAVLHTSA
jgi:AcrR family transcriptional regulator